MAWESAERVQKNDQGQYRALINGQWIPVAKAQKNAEGQYRVEREAFQRGGPTSRKATGKRTEIPAPRRAPSLADVGDRATGFRAQVAETGMTPEERTETVRQGAAFLGGLALGPVLGGVVRSAGAAVPAIQRFTAPVATALETGGFRTGLGKETPAVARLALRTGAGAVTGGGAAALIAPEDIGTGAAVGAALPVVLPPVASAVAKGGGYIADVLRGKTAASSANQLLRETIGDEVNVLRQAMAGQPDIPASRVASQMNLPALSALLQKAEELSPTGTANAFRLKETQDTINELARLAGGPTAETARAAREATKESLGELTGRMREEAFGAARRTGEVMPKLQAIATEARADAKKNVELVRRVSDAINRADDWARNWITGSRLVEGPGGTFTRQYVTNQGVGEAGVRLGSQAEQRYTFPGQLAESGRQTTVGGPFQRQVIDEGGTIARRVDEAAQASLQAGARARAAENAYQSMVDRKLEPITIDKFTSPIDNLLRDPAVATNPTLKNALPQVRQMFQDWADQYGVVTPEALEAIRKNGVSGIIQQLMPGADSKSQNRMAAQVLAKLKPAIDEAIEKAGGKNWSNYLKSFERGMSDIRGMELADQIRKWYESGRTADRQKIVNLLAGETPEVVEEFFGSGRYQIAKEMAKDMPFLERIGSAVQLDLKAAAQAKAGRKPLADIIEGQTTRIRFPFFTRASTAVNEVVEAIEKKVGRQTMDEIVKAAQSGRDFNKLLDAIPTKDRNAFLAQFKNAESWNKFSGQVAQAAQAQVSAEPRNALAPKRNDNALAR